MVYALPMLSSPLSEHLHEHHARFAIFALANPVLSAATIATFTGKCRLDCFSKRGVPVRKRATVKQMKQVSPWTASAHIVMALVAGLTSSRLNLDHLPSQDCIQSPRCC